MTDPSADIDAFLARLPETARSSLDSLRRTIRRVAPEAVEKIGYGVPAFSYRGRPLVSYGAGKAHCSFYVQSPAVIERFATELEGFDLSKGTVRFPPGTTLPESLVEMLVRARMEETEAVVER